MSSAVVDRMYLLYEVVSSHRCATFEELCTPSKPFPPRQRRRESRPARATISSAAITSSFPNSSGVSITTWLSVAKASKSGSKPSSGTCPNKPSTRQFPYPTLADIGLPRRTGHRWLECYDPEAVVMKLQCAWCKEKILAEHRGREGGERWRKPPSRESA